MPGVAWGSRQCLRVTPIWWLHKREEMMGEGPWLVAGRGRGTRVSLTLGGGVLKTERRQGRSVLGFDGLPLFRIPETWP